jgi:acyl-coenzyme A thioesterase PaaI-like protein
VTDIPSAISSVPSKLGTRLSLEDGHLVGHLSSPPEIAARGAVSIAAVAFLIDVVGGMTIDNDPTNWAFTSDLVIRLPLTPAPVSVETRAVILRNGARSAICDPVKPPFDAHAAVTRMPTEPLKETLRVAAGFVSRDRSQGVVASELRTELLNPAGAMQGAVVAGLVEAAAEDLADEQLGGDRPYVVTEMELRFLAQNRQSPIVSSARFVGNPADGLMRVDLFDNDGKGKLTAAAVVRVAPGP